jgi:hypothetical protein
VFYDHKEKMKSMKKEEKHEFMSRLRKIKIAIMDCNKNEVPKEFQDHLPFITPNRKLRECLRYDLKCSPQDYIPCMIYMMRFVEGKDKSIFKIFPMRTSMIPNYVPFDTATIIQLFIETGKHFMNKADFLTKGNVVKYQNQLWSWFFQTHKKVFTHKEKNTLLLVTDDKSIHFI